MVLNEFAYIICESDLTQRITNLTEETSNGKVIAEGILQTADEKNRNGRVYPEKELFPALESPRILELLGKGYLRAEMGHPLSKDLQRQSTIDDTNTCARFMKIWTQGKDIWGRFTATNNKNGAAFDADLREGCLPAWSLRALGSVKQTPRGMEVNNIRIITWDQVIYPSHPGAYTQRIISEAKTLNESAGMIFNEENGGNDLEGKPMIVPIMNESVISFLQASSKNLKFVRECCDFMFEDIMVNEAGTKVVLTTAPGETLVVNMESYIHNEFMNYASDIMERNW